MHLDTYTLTTDSHKLRYEFLSLGEKEQAKLIEFQQIPITEKLERILNEHFYGADSVFNLAFGDADNGDIDDKARTNNGDTLIVLRTVALATENFLLEKPSAVILFQGSTPERTRLYRIQLSKFYEEISSQFAIYSVCNGTIMCFKPNMKADAFFIRKK